METTGGEDEESAQKQRNSGWAFLQLRGTVDINSSQARCAFAGPGRTWKPTWKDIETARPGPDILRPNALLKALSLSRSKVYLKQLLERHGPD